MAQRETNPDYLKLAQSLSPEEAERVMSRMTGKLPKRLIKDKLTELEAIAIQLEIEDEQLQEWREKMEEIRNKSK